MKEKELQIGDWVYIFDPDYKDEKEAYKVSEIREDGIRTYMFNDTYEEGWFEPILLTPEILEKNGFSLERDGAYTYYDDVHIPEQQYIAVLFRHNLTARHIEIKRMRCHTNYDELIYVHQFQQALRLCGLNELADNLKV